LGSRTGKTVTYSSDVNGRLGGNVSSFDGIEQIFQRTQTTYWLLITYIDPVESRIGAVDETVYLVFTRLSRGYSFGQAASAPFLDPPPSE
jgi:hypothetical protein